MSSYSLQELLISHTSDVARSRLQYLRYVPVHAKPQARPILNIITRFFFVEQWSKCDDASARHQRAVDQGVAAAAGPATASVMCLIRYSTRSRFVVNDVKAD